MFGFDAPDQQVVISGLTMTNGSPPNSFSPDGGAIVSLDGAPLEDEGFDFGAVADLTVADSVISNSVADAGGGIALEVFDSASAGGLTLRNTTVHNNDAQIGGGVFATDVGRNVTITASTFSDNNAGCPGRQPGRRARLARSARDGGGRAIARAGSGAVVVENSTFAGNDADVAGGAIRFVSDAGNPGDPRTVRNSTIAGNSAAEGGGISVSRFDEASGKPWGHGRGRPSVGLSSTIVADNTASFSAGNADGPD